MKRTRAMVIPLFLVLAILLSACNLIAPQATATQDPASAQATVNAAVTKAMADIAAQLTSTAMALPAVSTATSTTAPTQTPAATATLVPTIPLPTSTPRPTAIPKPTATATPANYSCQLLSQSPAAGTKITVNTDFDASWKVKNTGLKAWEVGYVDLSYVSGQKMQTKADVFDITTAVAPGGELNLIVDMRAPSTAGKYSATWKLSMEGVTLCTLPVSIEAVNP